MNIPGFTADASLPHAADYREVNEAPTGSLNSVVPQWALPPWIPWWGPWALPVAGGLLLKTFIEWVGGVGEIQPIPCDSKPYPSDCPQPFNGVGTPCVYEGAYCRQKGWIWWYTGRCTTVKAGTFDTGQCMCKCVEV